MGRTHPKPVRPIVVVQRVHVRRVEVQVATGRRTVRRSRPIITVVAVILFHSQEQLEVRDKYRSKLFECDVADLVPLFDELRKVFIRGTVFPIAAQAFELADLFLVILVMLTEYGEQHLDFTFHDFSSTSNFQPNCAILPFTVIRHMTGISPFFFGALRLR